MANSKIIANDNSLSSTETLRQHMPNTLKLFLGFSSRLSGFSEQALLGTGMLQTYYDEVNLIIGEREMGQLLSAYCNNATSSDADFEHNILSDGRYGPVARNIIRLWYLGAWAQLPQAWRNAFGATSFDTDHIISPEAYQESLVWAAGETHPMGAKQQGFGAWSKPGPEPIPRNSEAASGGRS